MNWMMRRISKLLPCRRQQLVDFYRAHRRLFNSLADARLDDRAYVSGCQAQGTFEVGADSAVVDVEVMENSSLKVGRGAIVKHVTVRGDVTIGDGCMVTNSHILAKGPNCRIAIGRDCVVNGSTVTMEVPGSFRVGDGAVWECSVVELCTNIYGRMEGKYSIGKDSMLVYAKLSAMSVDTLSIGDRFSLIRISVGSTLLGYAATMTEHYCTPSVAEGAEPMGRTATLPASLTLLKMHSKHTPMSVVMGDDVLVWGKWTLTTKGDVHMGSDSRLWSSITDAVSITRRNIRMGRHTRLCASSLGGHWTQHQMLSGRTPADLVVEDGGQLSLAGSLGQCVGGVLVPAGSMVM